MAISQRKARDIGLLRKLAREAKSEKIKMEAIRLLLWVDGLTHKGAAPAAAEEPQAPEAGNVSDELARLLSKEQK